MTSGAAADAGDWPHAAGRALVEAWMAQRGWQPFAYQQAAWQAYLNGRSGLIHAPTGTGKTYAAWLGPIIQAVGQPNTARPPRLKLLWLTPLRALAADVATALAAPLADLGLNWTLQCRTGDSTSSTRARQRKQLPTVLITTPESLSLLLSWSDAAERFADLDAVVVDEWHELLGSKRGVQTELALARLRMWRPKLQTWGLSATIGNLPQALDTLLGQSADVHDAGSPPGELIEAAIDKPLSVDALLPESIDRFPWAGHLGLRQVDRVAEAIDQTLSALIFTNTRSQTELWYRGLLAARPDWAGRMALHHGSLDRQVRAFVEQGLRDHTLRAVVSTSTLDLGVDFAPVDRVFQVGSPKGIARLVQRAGRSGHGPGRPSRVTCVPTHALELIEVAAARCAMERGQIEPRTPINQPVDVLVQHVVTLALGGGFEAEALFREVRTTAAYRHLSPEVWRWVLDFVTRGGTSLSAYPDFHRVDCDEASGRYTVGNPRVARWHRMAIGTISSDAALQVRYVKGPRLGTIEEAFVARLKPGEHFVFAGKTLALVRIREMTVWVRKARGSQPAVPRWSGGRMPLSNELAEAVRAQLDHAAQGQLASPELRCVAPLLELQDRWSRIPRCHELLVERVQTREGHHLFVYPLAGRLVHEGLAALLAYRMSRIQPISFTWSVNDWGFELLSPDPPPWDTAWDRGLLDSTDLEDDILASLNAAELAKRQFREIAQIGGLVFPGYAGARKSARQLQASAGLFFEVFTTYDPENLLLRQAHDEVLSRQLEIHRLRATLDRLRGQHLVLTAPPRPTPFAFPLLVDRLRERLSSERLEQRIARLTQQSEKAAANLP